MEKSFYNFKKNENILNHELKIIITILVNKLALPTDILNLLFNKS